MKKQHLLLVTIPLSILALFTAFLPKINQKSPHIVIVFMDDMGYGDVIMEIDWSFCEILKSLKRMCRQKYPEILAERLKIAEEALEDLGDDMTNREGKNRRPSGRNRIDKSSGQ